jgi:hypothetical protein
MLYYQQRNTRAFSYTRTLIISFEIFCVQLDSQMQDATQMSLVWMSVCNDIGNVLCVCVCVCLCDVNISLYTAVVYSYIRDTQRAARGPYAACHFFLLVDEGPSQHSLNAFCATPMTMKMSSFFTNFYN